MSDGSVVQLHLRAAGDLARRLDDAGDSYLAAAVRSRTLLERAGAPTGAVTILHGAGDQLRSEAHDLADLVAQVRAIESGERPDPFDGLHISHTAYRSPFAAPGDASKAADEAWWAFAIGDDQRFLELNEQWSTEPDYAAAFSSQVGPAQLVDQLDTYRALRANAGYEQSKAAFVGLLQTLGVASRTGGPVPTFASLQEEIDRSVANRDDPSRYDLLPLLFEPDVQWSTQMLVDAAERYVLPANREVLRNGNDAPYQVAGQDGRVLVLQRVAADQWASVRVLDGNLDTLLPDRLRYGDGGKALGKVLVAGTAPGTPTASARAIDVIDWVAVHRDLPPFARDDLGLVAAPYVGSFRSDVFRDGPGADPLPTIDVQHSQEFLRYAAESERARRDLQEATYRWGEAELRDMVPNGYESEHLKVIGNVFANTAGARYHGGLSAAADQDQAFDDEKKGLNTIISLASGELPASSLISLGAAEIIEAAYPDGELAEVVGDQAQTFFAVDQIALNTLLVQTIWNSPDREQRFAPLPPPPELVRSDGRLKTFVDLSPTERQAMLRWLNQLDKKGIIDLTSTTYGAAQAGVR